MLELMKRMKRQEQEIREQMRLFWESISQDDLIKLKAYFVEHLKFVKDFEEATAIESSDVTDLECLNTMDLMSLQVGFEQMLINEKELFLSVETKEKIEEMWGEKAELSKRIFESMEVVYTPHYADDVQN